ncbi:hypothetical protein KY319_02905, partial [Candidatus Woesearchaeota archaeon]|nr:hypothetical protein [Candidatus Woesearchaeota archaeon]
MKQKRKAQVGGIIFIFVVFGLIFLFVFFYMWMEKNMTRHAEKQAEIVASDVELIAFYSELIQKHGIELAQKDNSGTEDVIEKFAEQYLGVNASYSADCSKTGDDKECKLTISLHATLGT